MIGPDLGRIEKAKEDRRIQLLKWVEYDRNYQNNFSNRVRKKASKRVEFGPNLVFLEAASRGDLKEVKKLIEDGINPDVANEDGLTALHQCCIDNNLEMCALLLENNANVNAKDNELWTPLHAAATCGNKELCGLLIDCGADLLALNIDGNMPYDLCDDDETLILVETEMAKRHVTQAQIDEIRLRPEKEMLNDLKRRHAAGDDLQSLDAQGAAPIHVAAACGYAEVARYLLQMRVDPQEPDADGWLPIHIAVSWGNLEIVEILVSYGADIEAPTKSGLTVYTICDSKEFRARLKEIWDRRDELRRAVRQNNLQQSFTRGMGSSRRRKGVPHLMSLSSEKPVTFKDLGFNDQILAAVERMSWKCPTEIQAASIPPALKGRNLIGLAETGSGKTGAYILPILQELMVAPKHYFAVILAPTRELAAQVQAQCAALGASVGLNTVLLVGGTPIVEQANQMALKPPHIIIATPGRFVDHLKRTKGFDEIKLKNVRFLVIDEADRMLGSDFESVIEKVLIVLPPKRQTFLFSATMTEKVSKLQRASLRDPVRISTRKSKFQTVESLRQYVHLVPQAQLETYLVYLLRTAFSPMASPIEGLEAIKLTPPGDSEDIDAESRIESMGSAIVFTRTRETSNKLSLLLRQFLTTPVITLNGDMPQAQRLGALGKFKRLPASCLVATDVAARGLDIPQVGLVVNYDVPLDAKTYMHRVGRTARAGRQGAALTILTQFSVVFYLQEIEKHLVADAAGASAKVPALIEPMSPADAALETAVAELNTEVQTAMALATKTVESLRKKSKGKREAFMSVDDIKTPSTAEIEVPAGTQRNQRTGWASEAPTAQKAQIAEVLAFTRVTEPPLKPPASAADVVKVPLKSSSKRRAKHLRKREENDVLGVKKMSTKKMGKKKLFKGKKRT